MRLAASRNAAPVELLSKETFQIMPEDFLRFKVWGGKLHLSLKISLRQGGRF